MRDGFHYCASGVGIGTILHDGAATGCSSVSRRFIEGRIGQNSFVELWETGFDVTPARLLTGLINEGGVCSASREGLLSLYPERRAQAAQ